MEKELKIMTRMDVPFAYTTFLAFKTLYEYQEKCEITFAKLQNFREILSLAFNQENDYCYYFRSVDMKEIEDFIKRYQHMFLVIEDKIILKEGYELDDLNKEIESFGVESHPEFDFVTRYSSECKEALGISYLYNMFLEFNKQEAELESLYQKLLSDDGLLIKKRIDQLLNMRNDFYGHILRNGSIYLDSCQTEMYRLKMLLKTTDSNLKKLYQNAMFENEQLATRKIICDFNSLYYNEMFYPPLMEPQYTLKETDAPNVYAYNYVKVNRIWLRPYLLCVKKIDEITELYGSNLNLLQTKYRLLYALDNWELKLYDSAHLETKLEEIIESHYCEEYLDYQSLVIDYINSIFKEGNDKEGALKKVIFISVYYFLTNDNEVIQKLYQYQNHPNYFLYANLIKNNGFQKESSRTK